jgi:putative ABC transport system permease protein
MTRGDGRGGARRAFRLPFTTARIDAELGDEFRFHIEERIAQFMATGMSRAEAEAEVRRRFGDLEQYRSLTKQIDEDTMRQRGRLELLDTVRREVRHAARVLLRTPAFSLIAFITLALGIGAATAIFTVLDAVVLRPLPYPDAGELVSVLHPATVPGSGERKWGLSAGGYFQFRTNTRVLDALAAYRMSGFTVVGDGDAELVRVGNVTASLFSVLRARAALGRLISPEDDKPGAARVAVLSHEFWERRFGGDRGAVGRSLQTSSGSYEIVGVAQRGLTLPMPGPSASSSNLTAFGVDVWIPLQLDPAGPFQNDHGYTGVGRLAEGRTVGEAQLEFARLLRPFPELIPTAYTDEFIRNYNFRVEVAPLQQVVLGATVPRTLWTLFGSVLLVLLIASANVANLFLVRMEARRREVAIRTALGAERVHMAVHHLAESLMLCLAAAVAGVGIAWVALRALLSLAPTNIPRLGSVELSGASVVFAVTLALLIGVIFGLMPLARRALAMAILREGGRGLTASPRQRLARAALVVGQMALALVLLASAGLMLRSFSRLREVRPGLDPRNVIAFDVSLPFTEFPAMEDAGRFHRELARRIAALPGVGAVGASTYMPFEDYGTSCTVVFRENRPYARGEEPPCVATPRATPGFFEAVGITVHGRTTTWDDVDALTQAVVLTGALAERLWPGEDPIGKGIGSNGWDSKVWYRIVGVIPEVRLEALDLAPTEAVFYAASDLIPNRRSGRLNDLVYFVRTSGAEPEALTPALRRILAEMNPRVPFVNPRLMSDVVSHSMARTSFIMIMLGIAAGTALLLSAVGMYGVISYLVAQRRSEIGVRIALGARMQQVARLVVMQSLRLALIGVALGLIGAFLTTKVLSSLLFGVSPTDPVVMIIVSLVLAVIAGAASFGPARRAARTDPMQALRSD